MTPLEAACAAFLSGLHLAAGRLRSLDGIPRSRWLSLAGGIAIAYVFVHLLPELAEADEALAATGVLGFLERHAYLAALAGLVAFYALDAAALRSRTRRRESVGEDRAGEGVLWVHAASYGLYNALIGYLVVRRADEGALGLVLFTVAIGVHFVVADAGLRDHHKHGYDRVVRWVLAAAVPAGLVAGALTAASDAALALLLAFLAGAVILNTIKEEVPGERRSRLAPFLAGAAAYAAVLLAV